MANFLDSYEPVEARIHRFWEQHPNGAIRTYIEQLRVSDAGQFIQVIVRAEVFRNSTDPLPAAIDYAEETLNASPVNRTSFIENAATSAIGRGLATLGFSPKGARPSVEEMGKAERVGEKPIIVKPQSLGEKWGVGIENESKPATKPQIDSIIKRLQVFASEMNIKQPSITWELGCVGLYVNREVSALGQLTRAEASQIIEDASNNFEILRPKYLDLINTKGKK